MARFLRCWSTTGGAVRRHRQRVSLSAPAVKRRVDRLRGGGALRGLHGDGRPRRAGRHTEALVELFYAPGRCSTRCSALARHPEVVEAWSVTGEADAIARVRTQDNADLERLIMDLQPDGLVDAHALAGGDVAAGRTGPGPE